MAKKLPWRVRVKLALETWVDIEAPNASIAEAEAAKLPNVISVFRLSATRADKVAGAEAPAGVQEDLL
jgi:hypothetical protein